MKAKIIVLIVWFTLVTQCLAKCPARADLNPCTCEVYNNEYKINCMQNDVSDIKSIFAKISKDPEVLNIVYAELSIGSNNIEELPERATGDVKFKWITIYFQCEKLKRIHYKAFESSWTTTSQLKIFTPSVENKPSPSPYSLLQMFNSFAHLDMLESHPLIDVLQEGWDGDYLHSISELTLRVGAIKGSPFAKFKNLQSLFIMESNLNFISAHALEVGQRAEFNEVALNIDLRANKLNSSSFEVGSLTNIALKSGRKNVKLDLSDNQIVYLDENVFLPFLKESGNALILRNNTLLDCDDCKSAWICKQPERLQMALNGCMCKDHNTLNNCESNFKKCI